jgi:hypothetical protein
VEKRVTKFSISQKWPQKKKRKKKEKKNTNGHFGYIKKLLEKNTDPNLKGV